MEALAHVVLEIEMPVTSSLTDNNKLEDIKEDLVKQAQRIIKEKLKGHTVAISVVKSITITEKVGGGRAGDR